MPRPTTGPHGVDRMVSALSQPIRPIFINVKTGRATSTGFESNLLMEIWTNLTAEDINRRDKEWGTVYFKRPEHVIGWAVNISDKQPARTGTDA